MKKNDISIQFSRLIDYILSYNEDLQNYFITGLFIFKDDDIEYFFRNRSPYEQIIFKFENERILVEEFNAILSSNIIQEVFKSAHNKIFDFDVFESQVLKRIFLLDTQPSLLGLICYDLRIYIKSFNYFKSKDPQADARAAIYIILLHELGHCMPRLFCTTRREVKNMMTPKFNSVAVKIEEDNKTEAERKLIRGEAGTRIEILLFGEKLTGINRDAGNILININRFEKKKDFRCAFKKSLEESDHTISLKTYKNHLLPVKCPMKRMFFRDN